MKFLIVAMLILPFESVLAQTTITGKVTDQKGSALPGVNIVIKDTYDGASTDADGAFNFTSTENGAKILVASSIGYKPFERTIELSGQSVSVNIQLQEEINVLDAVVISAGSFTAGDEKRRTILKAIDIATTAGATADIAGALNTLPGTQKVGESGRLFVRGGDSNETRTFIDGIAVLNAYGAAAPNTPSRGRFLPFMFKGTSFSTGGYSAEYGQALSSALILNSKDKAEMNQTDIGILSVGADVAHTQVWDKASWTGKIQYTNITPYFNAINQRIDWVSPPVSTEGSTAFRQQVGGNGLLKFFGNFNHADFSLYNHSILTPSFKQLYTIKNDYRYANASYKQALNDTWFVRSGFSYNYNQNAVRLDGVPQTETEEGTHSKVVFENSLNNHAELKLGAEVISRHYVASAMDATSSTERSRSFTEAISSSFAEAEVYASNHLVMRGGLRMEYNNLNNQLGVDPRASIAYKPKEKGQFSFAYGRFRQSAKNTYVRNNTGLGSEKAEHFILNYQIISNNRTFRVETFYKKYFDLVKFQYRSADTLFVNGGDGYAKGFEVFWRDNQTLKNVDYWVSYSYLDTKRNYLNYPYMAVPTFASTHNFSVVYKHFITSLKSQVGLTYSYSSPRSYFNPNTSQFNSDRTPSYQDLSVNISYLPKNWLILYVSCTNLLNHDNIFGYQFDSKPMADGTYASKAIRQPAQHFLFLGIFITLSKNKSVNQLPNL
jgi:hypothetical protein